MVLYEPFAAPPRSHEQLQRVHSAMYIEIRVLRKLTIHILEVNQSLLPVNTSFFLGRSFSQGMQCVVAQQHELHNNISRTTHTVVLGSKLDLLAGLSNGGYRTGSAPRAERKLNERLFIGFPTTLNVDSNPKHMFLHLLCRIGQEFHSCRRRMAYGDAASPSALGLSTWRM